MNSEAFELLLSKVAVRVEDDSADEDKASKPKRKGAPPEAKKIVNMGSFGGRLADLVSPQAFGGDRAGRSLSMARAAGRDPSFGVKHPLTQTLGYTTAGGALGSVTGSLLGNITGNALGAKMPGITNGMTSSGVGRALMSRLPANLPPGSRGAVLGSAGGGIAGALIGALLAAKSRRNDMRETNDAYESARYRGTLNPTRPNVSLTASALLPLRGPHRRGQMQGYYMTRGDDAQPSHLGTKAKYLAEHLPVVGTPAAILGGYGQNIATQIESGAARG